MNDESIIVIVSTYCTVPVMPSLSSQLVSCHPQHRLGHHCHGSHVYRSRLELARKLTTVNCQVVACSSSHDCTVQYSTVLMCTTVHYVLGQNQIKSNQIKSNQIKSNRIKSPVTTRLLEHIITVGTVLYLA